MPQYRFQVRQGKLFNGFCVEAAFEDREAAWNEAAALCGDLARDIMIKLRTDPEWLLEATDEAGQPVFRFRFVAESLDRKVDVHRSAARKARAPGRSVQSTHQRIQR
jgi:hypothetical protein